MDALGRPSKLTWYRAANQTTTAVAGYAYAGLRLGAKTLNPDGGNNRLEEVFRDSAASVNNYDAWGRRLNEEVNSYPGGTKTARVQIQHTYDVAGNPTWRYEPLMQAKATPQYWSQEYTYDRLGRLAKARRGKVNNWGQSTVALETANPPANTPYNWDWSQTDGNSLAGLDKLGNWNYFQFGVPGSLVTDDRGHDAVNAITSRTCPSRQAPIVER